jgi:tRNA dimethylallyltransferase
MFRFWSAEQDFICERSKNPFFESPKTDVLLREKILQIKEKKGAEHLHKILQKVDKAAAEKLFPRDMCGRRARVEVYFQTGNRFSELQPNRADAPEFAGRIQVFALNPPRDVLYEKINERAERHFQNGLVAEVERLRETGVKDETNALGAHGYRRVCEYLRGERDIESAIEKTKTGRAQLCEAANHVVQTRNGRRLAQRIRQRTGNADGNFPHFGHLKLCEINFLSVRDNLL